MEGGNIKIFKFPWANLLRFSYELFCLSDRETCGIFEFKHKKETKEEKIKRKSFSGKKMM
jgi:hypothetical protein